MPRQEAAMHSTLMCKNQIESSCTLLSGVR